MRPEAGTKPERFSPTAYAAKLQSDRGAAPLLATEDAAPGALDLRALTEEARHMLAAPRGWSEEERKRYAEKLNRAVIGFPQERAELLAIISDWIIKKRLQHIPHGSLPYGTLAEALFAEVIGLNVLELVLRHREGLEEVQVVGTRIFEVRDGRAVKSAYRFSDIAQVERIQQNLVLFNNDRINPRKRWAEVLLLDGSRVTMTGFGFTAQPTLTIRFYTVRRFDLETLARPDYRTIDDAVRQMLLCIVRARFNMVVIGATNTGKTHLIKALISAMPDEERIVTIEGRYELRLQRDFPEKNVVEYEAEEDDPLHGPRQAFKLALRQSPQRICHAEIRDEDANIYVRACTRGHEGSITSVHANTLEDVPEAITDMCMLDGRGMNPSRLTKRIAEHVTQIGFEMRMVGESRRLVRVGEFAVEGGEIAVRDWARYDEEADAWKLPLGLTERAWERIRRMDPGGYGWLRGLREASGC
ncbi:ATPase, T2SS/T4P/T4SS family [Cohnella nanjingensis]|uniref:Flp pilus assembly complex ATPase component TadA n=1 Tax=Cohnella nanjingensis TaxID=1387779 RepID=A0A7X0RSF2_9BACL|nr:ATPase, T2SS/T4P/T4SS family [Cohnella nanjingensis]MBB6672643.1 Flp pilus assembly complex ATPase component TadA [Cohnella nanjingensis]